MAAIESLRTALRSLARDPVLFLPGLLYGLIVLPQMTTRLLGIPSAQLLLQALTFFVTPFVIAGILGMAAEALSDGTTLSTFVSVGKARYVPLLLGNLVHFGITLAFVVLFVIVGLVALFVGGVGVGLTGAGAGAIAVVAAAAAVVALLYLAVAFFIQFFDVAIVVNDAGAVDGFRESVAFVRSNLLSTLGYSVIVLIASLLTSLPVFWFVTMRAIQASVADHTPGTSPGSFGDVNAASVLSPTEVVVLALLSLVLTTVLTVFQQTYAAAFYTRHAKSVEERVLGN